MENLPNDVLRKIYLEAIKMKHKEKIQNIIDRSPDDIINGRFGVPIMDVYTVICEMIHDDDATISHGDGWVMKDGSIDGHEYRICCSMDDPEAISVVIHDFVLYMTHNHGKVSQMCVQNNDKLGIAKTIAQRLKFQELPLKRDIRGQPMELDDEVIYQSVY